MPTTSHMKASVRADQRLSQLIKLKRLERPDAAFWESFEQEYRSRQLSSFVQIQPMSARLGKACLIMARKAAPPIAALSAVAVTVVAVNNFSYLSDSSGEDEQIELASHTDARTQASPEAYFIVQDSDSNVKGAREANENGTIYQMNVLSSGYHSNDGYLLDATPVTFTYEQARQSAGAEIIRSESEY